MDGRIIKAYIEMKNSQTQHTPLANANTNPKVVSQKAKRCLGKPDNTKTLTR